MVVVGGQDLIDRWRLSWPVVIAYAVVSMVGGFIALDLRGSRVVDVALACGIATGAALIVLLGSAAMMRSRRPARSIGGWFVPIALVVGLVRAEVLLRTADALDVPASGSPVSVALSSAFSAVVWLGLVGALVASQETYRDRYRELLSTTVRPDALDLDGDPGVRRMRSTIASALSAAEREPSADRLAYASAAIRHEIDATLKPLSHRLWFGEPGEEPHTRWLRVIRDSVSAQCIPIRTVCLLWLLGSMIGGVARFGWEIGVWAGVMSTAVLYAVLVLARATLGRASGLRRGMAAVSLGALLPILATDAILRAVGYASALAWDNALGLSLWVTLTALLVASAAVTLAASDRRAVIAIAAETGPLNTGNAHLASYLHNGLQSELTGLAMQFDAAARSEDVQEARMAIERAHAVLGRSMTEDFAAFSEEPAARAERVASAWAGICEVRITISSEARRHALLVLAVSAAEELVSNVVRHAGATRADVTIHADVERVLVVRCTANVRGDALDGSGMGSALVASIAARGVDVTSGEGATTYALRVADSPRA